MGFGVKTAHLTQSTIVEEIKPLLRNKKPYINSVQKKCLRSLRANSSQIDCVRFGFSIPLIKEAMEAVFDKMCKIQHLLLYRVHYCSQHGAPAYV